jgi:hypothetical protein
MSNTWGQQTWGFNQWNDLSNSAPAVSGISLSANIGSVTLTGEINSGWGRQGWNENGYGIPGTLIPSSFSLSANLGSVSVTVEVNVGWGSDAWGVENWGQSGNAFVVLGQGLSAAVNVGNVFGTANVTLTGIGATMATGSATAFSLVVVPVTGNPLTTVLSFDPENLPVTGSAATVSLGTAIGDANTIAEVSRTSTLGWGYKTTWGQGVWGNQTGDTLSMSMDEGTVDPSPDATATGQGMTAALSVGTVIAGDANTLPLTGIAMSASLGTAVLDANTIASITGFGLTNNLGSVTLSGAATIDLTGIGLTTAAGSLKTRIWNEVNTGTTVTWSEVDTAA